MESVHDNLVYVDFQNRRMSPNQNAALEEFAEWGKNFAHYYDLERLYSFSDNSQSLVRAVVELVESA
ncbi:hypothetical protein [Rhodoferax sp. GW822-FHT02A01]|uniref:hypothetical protein n=1 Tax=Rhodoferax sp. GW822-FHT02A01 TaxID=3141537 RepID=UPI00315CA57E